MANFNMNNQMMNCNPGFACSLFRDTKAQNFRPSTQPSMNSDTMTFSRMAFYDSSFFRTRFPNASAFPTAEGVETIQLQNPDIVRGRGTVPDLKLPGFDLASTRVTGGNAFVNQVMGTSRLGDPRKFLNGVQPLNSYTQKRQLPFLEGLPFQTQYRFYLDVVDDYQRRVFGTKAPDKESTTDYSTVVTDDLDSLEESTRIISFPALNGINNSCYGSVSNDTCIFSGVALGGLKWDSMHLNNSVFGNTIIGGQRLNSKSVGFFGSVFGQRAKSRTFGNAPAFPGIGASNLLRNIVSSSQVLNSTGGGTKVDTKWLRKAQALAGFPSPDSLRDVVVNGSVVVDQSKIQIDKAVTNTGLLSQQVPQIIYGIIAGIDATGN